ncbi:uncharacterized protein LOC115215941 isoform X3, partial [Argonauta hians]
MKLFLIFLLSSCLVVETVEGLPDLAGIIAGLSSKTIELLKSVTIPVLDTQIGFIRSHIENFVSFLKGSEGDIPVPETQFVLHYVADRCTILGRKRFIVRSLMKCKATVTERDTGLSATCEKHYRNEAIDCASAKVIDLLKILIDKVKTVP